MGKCVMKDFTVIPWNSFGTTVTAISFLELIHLLAIPLRSCFLSLWKKSEKAGIFFSSETYVIETALSQVFPDKGNRIEEK